jgi:hypothetical protein
MLGMPRKIDQAVQGPLRGTTGKAQIEHKISASPPTPDIRADIVVRRFVPITDIVSAIHRAAQTPDC